MTDLRKEVKRRTVGVCHSARRRLIIMLCPGDVLAIREEGRRMWYRAPLGKIYINLVRWNAEAIRLAKAAEKKARRAAKLEDRCSYE